MTPSVDGRFICVELILSRLPLHFLEAMAFAGCFCVYQVACEQGMAGKTAALLCGSAFLLWSICNKGTPNIWSGTAGWEAATGQWNRDLHHSICATAYLPVVEALGDEICIPICMQHIG